MTSPIPRSEFDQRIDRARTEATRLGWDGLLVIGRSFYDRVGHLAYFSNHFPSFPASPFVDETRGLGHAILLIPRADAPTLLIDGRAYRRDLVAVDDVRGDGDLVAGSIELLRDRGMQDALLGLAGEDILPRAMDRPIEAALPGLRLAPADPLVHSLRARKSAAEIALLRHAASLADLALAAAVATCQPGATEHDVSAAGTAAALRGGADFVRYVRVHSGAWAGFGSRWPPATDRVLANGDVVVLDAIGAYQGYQFDVNRTTVVGTPSTTDRALLESGERATAAAVQACQVGATVADVIRSAMQSLERDGVLAYATSFIGHSIGLETVEPPYLQSGVRATLEEGMVLCVEPSLRVPEQSGCAIEQEVVIRAAGPEDPHAATPTTLW